MADSVGCEDRQLPAQSPGGDGFGPFSRLVDPSSHPAAAETVLRSLSSPRSQGTVP